MRSIGFLLYIFGLLFSLVLAFAYRDYSFQLLLIFLLSTSALTIGTYIASFSKAQDCKKISEEDLDVIGKFSIYRV